MMFRWTLLEEEVSKRLKEAEQLHQEVVVLGEEKKREGEQVIEFPLAHAHSQHKPLRYVAQRIHDDQLH